MRKLLSLCLISMLTIHAQAQTTVEAAPTKAARLQRSIMVKQLQTDAQLKTTAIAKRLTGHSHYDGSVMTDSTHHKYRPALGSALSDYFSYLGVNIYYAYDYFDPADPLAFQTIPSDSSILFQHDGTSLVLSQLLANDYDSKRNLTHTLDYTEDQTLERFITSNSIGQRSTVIERDSGDGTQPYIDRVKHHFTYDNQNRVVLDSAYMIPAALTYSKTYYHYNSAGYLTDYIQYIELGGPPTQEYKIEFTYDGSNRLLSATDYYDFGSGWKPTNRYSYSYTGTAMQYTKFVVESWNTSAWYGVNGEIYELNSSNQISRRYRLESPGSTLDTMFKSDFTYNSAGLIESSQGAKYLGNGNYSPTDQFEHFYYEDYQTSGIAEKKAQELFVIYPNPAANILRLSFAKAHSFAIIDQSGRIIRETATLKNNDCLDVSDLPAGNYLLRSKEGTNMLQRFTVVR